MGEFGDPLRLLAQKLGDGIGDVRDKLVFEGWFGRSSAEPARDAPTQAQPAFGSDAPGHRSGLAGQTPGEGITLESFERQWAVREPWNDPERAAPVPELGMDR